MWWKMKTGILITARLKSQRLPRKVLKPLCGKPMLWHLVERLRQSKFGEQIVLCTSTVEQDDPLEEFANDHQIKCFRGHPDDVLLRNLEAAEKFGFDLVLSCTADNPFIDEVWMDRLAKAMAFEKADFGTISGLPFGSHSYSFTTAAARKVCDEKEEVDTEIWGAYFTQSGLFNCLTVEVTDTGHHAPHYRLTVDEPSDFSLAEAVLTALDVGRPPTLPEVIKFLDDNPDVAALNAEVQQKAGKPIKFRSDNL
jgi:spore coat polysaccharide biosynthesis protein SpsF